MASFVKSFVFGEETADGDRSESVKTLVELLTSPTVTGRGGEGGGGGGEDAGRPQPEGSPVAPGGTAVTAGVTAGDNKGTGLVYDTERIAEEVHIIKEIFFGSSASAGPNPPPHPLPPGGGGKEGEGGAGGLVVEREATKEQSVTAGYLMSSVTQSPSQTSHYSSLPPSSLHPPLPLPPPHLPVLPGVFPLLFPLLPHLSFECRKDAASVFSHLLRWN